MLTKLVVRQSQCLRKFFSGPNIGKTIDLRSDTVTRPSEAMLDAMMGAEVGDDVYKEDPSINKLEEKCAQLMGKEGALFVPSGTMGNLICLLTHCSARGESVIIGADQHVCCREQGNYTQFGSIVTRTLPNNRNGTISLSDVRNNICDDSDFHKCSTKLICLENTHMRCGGIPLTQEYMQDVGQLAREHKMAVHVDGARILNAAVALGCDVSQLLEQADSVSMCLSKGVGCPIGSVIGGSQEFIHRATRIRKSLGGGLRQAGYLAAAGLYALDNVNAVLEQDHRMAQQIAHGIKSFNSAHILDVDLDMVCTNLLLVRTQQGMARKIVDMLRQQGILCGVFDASTIRFATHLGIRGHDVEQVLSVMKKVLEKMHV